MRTLIRGIPDAHLICFWRFLAMASGSICSPSLKEPTVWPAGLGGKRASLAGGGLAFFSCIILSTPAMMLPPFFSRSYTCMVGKYHGTGVVQPHCLHGHHFSRHETEVLLCCMPYTGMMTRQMPGAAKAGVALPNMLHHGAQAHAHFKTKAPCTARAALGDSTTNSDISQLTGTPAGWEKVPFQAQTDKHFTCA